jgi:hypothetical protein
VQREVERVVLVERALLVEVGARWRWPRGRVGARVGWVARRRWMLRGCLQVAECNKEEERISRFMALGWLQAAGCNKEGIIRTPAWGGWLQAALLREILPAYFQHVKQNPVRRATLAFAAAPHALAAATYTLLQHATYTLLQHGVCNMHLCCCIRWARCCIRWAHCCNTRLRCLKCCNTQGTYLPRFYGLHRWKPEYGSNVRFVVMNNVFATNLVRHARTHARTHAPPPPTAAAQC